MGEERKEGEKTPYSKEMGSKKKKKRNGADVGLGVCASGKWVFSREKGI